MGCSSSAQTQDSNRPAAKPSDADGLQKCDENSPTTDENETIPDQTKLDSVEEVDFTPDKPKPSENLPAEKTEVFIPASAECLNSNYKRVDLEGTLLLAARQLEATGPPVEYTGIPPPAGAAEGTGIPPPAGAAEGTGIPPPAGAAEGTGIPPPAGAAEGTGIPPPAGVAEGSVSPVTEVVGEVQISEEDQLIEGETGENVETEKHSELGSEGTETKEEETGDAAGAPAATEIEATNIEE